MKIEQAPKSSASKKKSDEFQKRKGTDQDDTPKPKKLRMNKTETDFDSLVVTCANKTADNKSPNFKLVSWNVNGIRSLISVRVITMSYCKISIITNEITIEYFRKMELNISRENNPM